MKHLITLENWSAKRMNKVIDLAEQIKAKPEKFFQALKQKTLLMIFEKESLRTRLSFETGMTQLGGHAIYLNVKHAPLGEKENIQDTIQCASRYVDIIMARIKHPALEEISNNSKVPVINAMTDFSHPCQILGDLLTIKEKKKELKGLKLVYMGDSDNNITHSLMYACPKLGINLTVICPQEKGFKPQAKVIASAKAFAQRSKTELVITDDIKAGLKDADVVYTDTWISYYIPEEIRQQRIEIMKKFQVNKKVLAYAKKSYIFMHCLPVLRGQEATASVVDGRQSVIYDQAENRLHIQKAIILDLLNIN